jgi:hypothetical protein
MCMRLRDRISGRWAERVRGVERKHIRERLRDARQQLDQVTLELTSYASGTYIETIWTTAIMYKQHNIYASEWKGVYGQSKTSRHSKGETGNREKLHT